MATAANLGYPRIGAARELKRALESYWRGGIGAEELCARAADLRRKAWLEQRSAGIDHIPSNDFSLYDHMLDTAALVGAIPERYRCSAEGLGLDGLFAMARGAQSDTLDVQALEMRKWFDTNYHTIVPEIGPATELRLSSSKPFDEHAEAKELGIASVPVLVGPVSFLLLSRWTGRNPDDRLELLEPLVEVYAQAARRLTEAGAQWIQLDEPCFVEERSQAERRALERAYRRLAERAPGARFLVQTYFDQVGEAYPTLIGLPVHGIGLDFVRGRRAHLALLEEHGFPSDKTLRIGVVDGRNVWINDLERSLELLERVAARVDPARLQVAPSCSLLHVPLDASRETHLDPEIRSWLAFALQKLGEVAILARGLNGGRHAIRRELEANQEALDARRSSERTRRPAIRRRLEEIALDGAGRETPFEERQPLQRARLHLPDLPTTTVGSFPQTKEVRQRRDAFRRGRIGREEYERFLEQQIDHCLRVQEDAGLDVLVHGEFERNDMVEYFAERMEGFAFTRHGWVQSYGSRCVKPPILYGDVRRPEPITVRWWRYAASRTARPVKGMLTGPVTLLQWSFVRDDQPRATSAYQLALAVRAELEDLQQAGAAVIQVDEPALREGLPLRGEDRRDYLRWAVNAFRVATSTAWPQTQIQTHMCYSEFDDVIESIARMDADVLLIENARSNEKLLQVFRDFDYHHDLGPGLYDIHSPRVPSAEELAERLRHSLQVLPAGRLWVTPDCGLKTRSYQEVVPALTSLVEAARTVRAELVGLREAGSSYSSSGQGPV
jgi:5-methyltetrahydropteroyltriglutamate--homocysteine methyltransferase